MTTKRILMTLMVLFVALMSTAFYWYQWQLKQHLPVAEEGIRIEVKAGQSLSSVLEGLQRQGILNSTLAAKLYARQNELSGQIKIGEFLVPQKTTVSGLFEILTSNDQVQYRITFVEGQTIEETLERLRLDNRLKQVLEYEVLLEDGANLLKLFSAGMGDVFKSTLGISPPSPEGLIYPDTYFYHRGDTDLSLLMRAHERLLKVLAEEWSTKQENVPLKSPYEALILASIVEKETGKPSERGEIAGVFARRLIKGMRLQTDPTVIYGLGDRYQGNITRAHLKEKTPYNTYRINGLPPTPIALAGRAAIRAALNPLKGDTLFFVAKGDGSHQFSRTIDEHNRAVRKYQLSRREDYRSTHQQVK